MNQSLIFQITGVIKLPTRLSIYPYKLGSQSAINLANALGVKRLRQNGKYRWKIGHKIINWGNTRIANWMTPFAITEVWNKPVNVDLASNKYTALHDLHLAGISIPDFTSHLETATLMLEQPPKYPNRKHAILCRTLTRANSGRGIVLAETPEQLVPAPLYTRYVPKQDEYRIHVFRELGVIDAQQKRRNSEVSFEDRDPYIRNHDAGWVFCREDIHPPQVVLNAAMDSVLALGLDFGAVDIGFHNNIGVCVYEVNTAPGLEGQTLTNYVNAFKQLYVL